MKRTLTLCAAGLLLLTASLVIREQGSPASASDEPQARQSDKSQKKSKRTGKKSKTSKSDAAKGAKSKSNAATGAAAWPRFGGPHGTGVSDEKSLAREFPADGPKILWRAALGTGFSGIAVADGKAYTLFGDGGREKVVCFDAATGDEIWKIDSDKDYAGGRAFGPRATPCVDGDRVYVVGALGHLQCLRVANGEKVWDLKLYEELGASQHEEGLSPSPLVDGERLVVAAGNNVVALDKLSGKEIWKSLDEPMNHSSPLLAELNGQRQLLILSGSNLVGMTPESGAELWRHPQQGVNVATPVVGADNQVFVGAAYGGGGQLVKVNGGSAEQVYKTDLLGPHTGTPMLHEGKLYCCHDRVGTLKCLDFASGEQIWESRDPGKAAMILADGQLIMLTEGGELVLAPASTEGFQPSASARVLTEPCYTAPSLANGRLYIRSDRELVCIDMKE